MFGQEKLNIAIKHNHLSAMTIYTQIKLTLCTLILVVAAFGLTFPAMAQDADNSANDSETGAAQSEGAAIIDIPLENGITKTEIILGQAAAFEGPAKALGIGMRDGMWAAFNEANKAGGIYGRMIKLVSHDDAYEPHSSIQTVRRLIYNDKVFALVGAVGTPTSAAIQPIATAENIPFVGAFTGAEFLRNPELKNVINIRASYEAETEQWMRYLVDEKGYSRIAILYQDDAFGQAGLSGAQAALNSRDMEFIAKGVYARNTIAVKRALLFMRKLKPQAVVMVGAYPAITEFVKAAKQINFNPEFVTISFVGASALAKAAKEYGKNIIISEVVPFPWDKSLPLIDRYHQALGDTDSKSEIGFITLEGYLVGLLTIEALKLAGPNPTRDSFIDGIYRRGEFEFGGVTMLFGPQDNQGLDEVHLIRINPDAATGFEQIP